MTKQTSSQEIFTSADHAYMAEALRLAKKGLYTTDPNPRVGCVIVLDNEIVGRGWHRKAGEGHAEVNALKEAGERAQGACAYVTLEPCSHFGRTPPCANALVNAGVTNVVAAMQDPNPSVAGRGYEILRAAGVSVKSGLLESQARLLNPGFVKRMESGRPWVRIKMAMSVDGRTAMKSGESQWITGPDARSDVQRLRARSSAVMTGIGTLLHDDAALTVRAEQLGFDSSCSKCLVDEIVANQPLRVVLDSSAQMPLSAKLLTSSGSVLWVISSEQVLKDEQLSISQLSHVDVLRMPEGDKPQRLLTILKKLAELGCNELLVEAGATLAGAFMETGCWDELVLYVAPKLLGSDARALVSLPLAKMSEAKGIVLNDMAMVGDDIRLTYSSDLTRQR